MNSLSLVLQCLNESEFIGDCLRATLPYVQQSVVIDQGSTDGTLEILANEFPDVRVIHADGNFLTRGEKYFRDLAIHLCESQWLMLIDCDEILSDGWRDEVDTFLKIRGHDYGMVNIDYFQMVASAEFHTPNSPLPNERPFLVRKHPGLRASESLNGTKCHSSYRSTIQPDAVGQLPPSVACFHVGYCKTDLTKRFLRNIERCDWSSDPETNRGHRMKALFNPLQFLPDCIPSQIPHLLLPSALRVKKWICTYDAASRRITERIKA